MTRTSGSGHSGRAGAGTGRLGLQYPRDRRDVVGTFEGMLAGDQLVEQDPERELVGARVDRVAAHDLGRHVARGAGQGAGSGQRLGVSDDGSGLEPREPEVDHLDPAVRRVEHVLRLEVPVQHALRVRRGQRPRDIEGDGDDLGDSHPARADLHGGAQGAAGDVLLYHVELAVELLEREDGRDARVGERPGRHRLAAQPRAQVVVVGERRRQRLDGHWPLEPRVLTEVDDAHAAAAEQAGDFIGAEATADQRVVVAGEEQAGVRLHGRPVDGTRPAVHLQQRQHLGAQGGGRRRTPRR